MSGWSRRRWGLRRSWYGWLCGTAWLVTLPCPDVSLAAQTVEEEELDDENPYRPGVVARFSGADGKSHERLEELISLSGHEPQPDLRIAPGPFRVMFVGHVLVQAPGEYRLRAFAAGGVRIKLADHVVLDGSSPQPGWLNAKPMKLEFGFHPLTVEYECADGPARLALFWEGPGFALEPLAARWLFHERAMTPDAAFERGQQAARALRCAACHEVSGEARPLAAPSLERLAGNISRVWIVERLSDGANDSPARDDSSSRSMPHFALARDDAAAVADYLLTASLKSPPALEEPSTKGPSAKHVDEKRPTKEPASPSAATGATLFNSVGCLACHRVGELGRDGSFGGGDLSAIASKRPADFFARWLAHPESINRQHRMPVFSLDEAERASLSLYLQTLGEPATDASAVDTNQVARGAAIVKAEGCGACHSLPNTPPPDKRLPLDLAALENESRSCLLDSDATKNRPGYRLAKSNRQDLADYLRNAHAHSSESIAGADVLVERNCLACHARGNALGLAAILPGVTESDATLAAALPLLRPPSLVGVGDKLRDDALAAAITRADESRQTWLLVRMPRFPLNERETTALVRHFIDADRIPEQSDIAATSPAKANDSTIAGAGARLVNADGFGCTSCHAIGRWTPLQVAPGSEGASLSQIGQRVRQSWFDRWVRNPVRIVPDMEMPAIVKPIRGVLDDDVDSQIAALWHVLNIKNFTPPAPNALRVERHSNLPGDDARASVLTDVIEVGNAPFAKPLVIGLANRHNVLFDLATGRLAAWWTGDTARQQTRGKSWFWQAGMPQLWPQPDTDGEKGCELVLLRGDERIDAVPRGQYITEFDALEYSAGGVQFTHRLHYPGAGGTNTVFVQQQLVALPETDARNDSGFARNVQISSLPEGARGELLVLPGQVTIEQDGRTATLDGPARLRVELIAPRSARLTKTPRGAAVVLEGERAPTACELRYRAEIAVDQFAPLPAVDRRLEKLVLDVVPGFDAVRLPLDDRCMPTGLAWRSDGTLVAASLEGRVWLARDTDDDGLEDSVAPFSDDLAAPYGVAAAGDAIDVINKYGLLRLFDADRDGFAERTEQIASGWGHTRDYHDWAVGLERDPAGNYYVALPCEQDDRSEAAANLRGRALRLVPRKPTRDDPRLYALEEICAGLRFPQGLALSPDGELFATDNQGNYNPFNELNHLRPDKRYGFINSQEAKRGLTPPLESAAIEIPHPWTRSVNGLCFLHVPGESEAESRKRFGPFAGHLVGCEYDTRRLVRMTLQKVDGQYQGAVYPLSREPREGEETFEGPVSCAISPGGDLYIGNLRDSGWGAGSNTGSIVRLRWQGQHPPGIAEVRALHDGFTIKFTQPVDRMRAADAANYAVSSYRRISTPDYGGPDVDRRIEIVQQPQVAEDGRSVNISLPKLHAGFVYEFHLRNLADGEDFFPAEAYYTMRRVAGG